MCRRPSLRAALRTWVSPAVALALLAPFTRPQNADWNSTAQEAHLRAVRAERSELLREALVEADPDEALLERLRATWRTPGAGAGSLPSLGAMMDSVRRLRGEEPSRLQQLADSLDLQPVPGAFAARSTGRGPVLRVRVYPLYRRDGVGDLHVNLYWRGPDGTETRARRESAAQTAFALPGFEMFVRAPVSEPGLWMLVPELEQEGVRARGVPVPVPCVAGALEAPSVPTLHLEEEWLRIEWQLLLENGLRSARGVLAPRRGLEAFARRELDTSPSWSGDREFPTGWTRLPEAPQRVLVLVCPSEEAPGAVFREGSPWRTLVDSPYSVCISTSVRVRGEPSLESVIAAARASHPELAIVLVVRGDGAARLSVEYLGKSAPAVDAAVVAGSPVDLERHWGEGPWLVVGEDADAWSTDEALPERVAGWLLEQGL